MINIFCTALYIVFVTYIYIYIYIYIYMPFKCLCKYHLFDTPMADLVCAGVSLNIHSFIHSFIHSGVFVCGGKRYFIHSLTEFQNFI